MRICSSLSVARRCEVGDLAASNRSTSSAYLRCTLSIVAWISSGGMRCVLMEGAEATIRDDSGVSQREDSGASTTRRIGWLTLGSIAVPHRPPNSGLVIRS